MKIDLIKLNKEVESGMINKQNHPTLPLFIYKYSNECVYSRHWNEITMRCRGLVLDSEGNIIINCMEKFFNHSEQDGIDAYNLHKESKIPYVVTEKMDGSLIQVALYNDELIVTSSGSFASSQALQAAEWIKTKYSSFRFQKGLTYIFEIIYKNNRIVLNYKDKESLTLLTVRDTDTGKEYEPYKYPHLYPQFDIVSKIDKTLEEIEKEISQEQFINKEGYVIRFDDGYRVKMKYDSYIRLHKIISGISESWVWEILRDKINIEEILKDVPDELMNFVKATTKELKFSYKALEDEAKRVYDATLQYNTRKEQAAFLMENYKDVANLVFCMLDKKDYSEKIWKMIKPENTVMFGRGEY